jgi:uncharacterized membrane protein
MLAICHLFLYQIMPEKRVYAYSIERENVLQERTIVMRTVVGLFDTYQDTEHAVEALQQWDIAREHINVIVRDTVLQEQSIGEEETAEDTRTGVVAGTAIGSLSGLLVGFSAITMPGIGSVIIAGTLLSTSLAGAGIGAATGGIIGTLTSTGISESDAQIYAESIQQGGILLTVEVDDELVSSVREALDRANAVDIAARREELRRRGWERFDETSPSASDTAG